jgi:YHS domain-containing protein
MATERVLDPVCGMRIDPADAAATVRHGGVAYHFCSDGCARRFQASPSKFLGGATGGIAGQGGHAAGGHGTSTASKSGRPMVSMEMSDASFAPTRIAADEPAAAGWRAYQPLITIFALLLVAVVAMSIADPSGGRFRVSDAIVRFMAGFFLVFAGFKLLDLRGFADGYATYDLLAQKVPAYGYVYPFIELGFGLVMLTGYHGLPLLVTEIVVMAFSGAGVAIKLAKKERFNCACLGTFLKVPLTKVTLVEDFGMAVLAAILLFL